MAQKKSDNITQIATGLTIPTWTQEGPGIGTPIDVAARILRDLSILHDVSAAIINAAADDEDLSASGKAKARKTAGETQLAAMVKLKADAEAVITSALKKAKAKKPERTAEEIAERISLAKETRFWLERIAERAVFPLPKRYSPNQGVQNNSGIRSLALRLKQLG